MGKDGANDTKTKEKQKKRSLGESKDSDDVSKTRRPKRAKKYQIVEDEIVAIRLTTSPETNDEPRPNRRLTDFRFHDSHGVSQPVEMLELGDMFITGLILPLDDNKRKEKRVMCKSFGRVETWDISGYEDGSDLDRFLYTATQALAFSKK